MRHCALLVVLTLVLTSSLAFGTPRIVDQASGPYYDIRSALAEVSQGDTVRVMPGTYTGYMNCIITTGGIYPLVLESFGGPDVTIIDCEDSWNGISFTDGEDTTAVFRGFTVRNALGFSGAGLAITAASPLIENCVFEGCSGTYGAGAWIYDSNARIRNCVFRGNTANQTGGGMYLNAGSPWILRCLFDENIANGGGAIYAVNSNPYIRNCTLVENGYDQIRMDGSAYVQVASSVIAFSQSGPPISIVAGSILTTSTVVYGNASGDSLAGDSSNNLFADPLFCNAAGDDYTYCADSPCLAANGGWTYDVGAYHEGCPDCDTPVEERTWGSIKALYR